MTGRLNFGSSRFNNWFLVMWVYESVWGVDSSFVRAGSMCASQGRVVNRLLVAGQGRRCGEGSEDVSITIHNLLCGV